MHDVFRNVGKPYFSQLIYRTVKAYGQSNASTLITFADRLFISPNEVLSNCFLNGCEQCVSDYNYTYLHIYLAHSLHYVIYLASRSHQSVQSASSMQCNKSTFVHNFVSDSELLLATAADK